MTSELKSLNHQIDLEEDIRWWRGLLYLWVGRINTIKTVILSNWPIVSMWRPLKFHIIFHSNRKGSLKFIWSHQRPGFSKIILSNKNHAESIPSLGFNGFKLYHRVILIKQHGTENRHVDQWNRTESPELNSCSNSHIVFDKNEKHAPLRKDSLFNKLCWETSKLTCRKMKPDPCLSPRKKKQSKWIKDFNVRLENMKPLEKNTSRYRNRQRISENDLQLAWEVKSIIY